MLHHNFLNTSWAVCSIFLCGSLTVVIDVNAVSVWTVSTAEDLFDFIFIEVLFFSDIRTLTLKLNNITAEGAQVAFFFKISIVFPNFWISELTFFFFCKLRKALRESGLRGMWGWAAQQVHVPCTQPDICVFPHPDGIGRFNTHWIHPRFLTSFIRVYASSVNIQSSMRFLVSFGSTV